MVAAALLCTPGGPHLCLSPHHLDLSPGAHGRRGLLQAHLRHRRPHAIPPPHTVLCAPAPPQVHLPRLKLVPRRGSGLRGPCCPLHQPSPPWGPGGMRFMGRPTLGPQGPDWHHARRPHPCGRSRRRPAARAARRRSAASRGRRPAAGPGSPSRGRRGWWAGR